MVKFMLNLIQTYYKPLVYSGVFQFLWLSRENGNTGQEWVGEWTKKVQTTITRPLYSISKVCSAPPPHVIKSIMCSFPEKLNFQNIGCKRNTLLQRCY